MVFGWVSAKFKERQLQKALIQNNAEDMVIVNGMSILNPNYRLFYNYPFYDKETNKFRGFAFAVFRSIVFSYLLSV